MIMKQFCLLCLFFVLFIGSIKAQVEPKAPTFFIGGGFDIDLRSRTGIDSNFVQTPAPNDQNLDFGLSSRFGYEISPRYALGVGAGFSRSVSDRSAPFGSFSATNDYFISIFGRYVMNPQDRFSFFTEISTSYDSQVGKNALKNPTSSYKQLSLSTNLSLGFLYNINERFRVTGQVFQIGYTFQKFRRTDIAIERPDDNRVSSGFGFNTFNNYLQFGFEYRFQGFFKRKQ